MSWLSKLMFWRDDEPEISQIDGYDVEGCFVPNEVDPDTVQIGGDGLEEIASEIPEIGSFTQRESGPR